MASKRDIKKSQGIMIIGAGHVLGGAIRLALTSKDPNIIIMTQDEFDRRQEHTYPANLPTHLPEPMIIKPVPIYPELEVFAPPMTRAERRKQKRKNK
jgi:hypothetical protein